MPFGDSRTAVRSAPIAAATRSVASTRKRIRFSGAAIIVVAQVGAAAQELVDQIAIGAVQLDAVEAGLAGVARGAFVVVEDAGDVVAGHARASA